MAQIVSELAASDPNRLAVDDGREQLSRRELNDRLNRMTSVLRAHGVGEGDVVAIMLGNGVDFVVTLMAAVLSGVSQVAVNWHLGTEEVEYVLESSGAKLLVVDLERAASGRMAAAAAGVATVLVFDGSLEASLLEAAADEPAPSLTASAIFYTSGTTGRPKATRMAEMGHGTEPAQLAAQAERGGTRETDRSLVVGPLYHGAPMLQAIRSVVAGAELFVLRSFDAEEVLRRIEAHRINGVSLVPTHCVRLLHLPQGTRQRYDVSSLQRVTHFGSIMPVEVKRAMIEWFGPILVDAYGCSELGTITTINSTEWLAKPGSVGRAVPWFTLQIVDERDREVGPGEIGTVFITAHNDADIVYLGDPAKTEAAHRSPKQFTLNDLGYLDEDGYLFLVDRRVDLIISGGVNIYPAEVESVLLRHDAVEDAAVFGIPHREWGHEIKAAVSTRPGHEPGPLLEAVLIGWAREQMAHFKVPKSIDFHPKLPRDANGKLHRRALRAPYWADAAGPGE